MWPVICEPKDLPPWLSQLLGWSAIFHNGVRGEARVLFKSNLSRGLTTNNSATTCTSAYDTAPASEFTTLHSMEGTDTALINSRNSCTRTFSTSSPRRSVFFLQATGTSWRFSSGSSKNYTSNEGGKNPTISYDTSKHPHKLTTEINPLRPETPIYHNIFAENPYLS